MRLLKRQQQPTPPPDLAEHFRAKGQLDWYIDYVARNKRASAGLVAHDYCWGPKVGLPGCISCGCSEAGPCISHRPPKAPR